MTVSAELVSVWRQAAQEVFGIDTTCDPFSSEPLGKQLNLRVTRTDGAPREIFVDVPRSILAKFDAKLKAGALLPDLRHALADLRSGLDALHARCGPFRCPPQLRFTFTGFASVTMGGEP